MIKIVSNIIPFKGFLAMCIWPFLFIRKENAAHFSWRDENHENIHAYQQVEMLVVGCILSIIMALFGCEYWSMIGVFLFYWWYLIEWLVKCFIYGNTTTAYKNVSFEREAYDNQESMTYLNTRDFFEWLKYI